MAATTVPKVHGVHLVGSIPLSTEEDAFRTICKALPDHILRLPDGEPGERDTFVFWQLGLFQKDKRVVDPTFNPEAPSSVTEQEMMEILESLQNMETRYDEFALRSYAKFSQLKEEGVIPQHMRFQVGLPPPVDTVASFVGAPFRKRVEPIYKGAMLRSLNRIQSTIPAESLAVQWDAAVEFGLIEDGDFYGRKLQPWFEPVFEGIIDRLTTLGEAVSGGVELGYHLCYGDAYHKHFIQPKDMGNLVKVANALLANCKRKINWIHMPVPKERTDRAYFEPLKDLVGNLGETVLSLGLVHFDDLDGTNARIRMAGEFAKSFSVATECGMGRTPPEQLQNILEISKTVSKPVR